MSAPRRSALGIDHGERRCGFAVADPLRLAVSPLAPWQGDGHSPQLLAHVAKLLEERDVGTFVVGMPYNMDGSLGPRSDAVRAFAARLAERFPRVRVVFVDERLSTKAAEELLRESGVKPRDRKALKDSFSALVVLRDWIASGEPG